MNDLTGTHIEINNHPDYCDVGTNSELSRIKDRYHLLCIASDRTKTSLLMVMKDNPVKIKDLEDDLSEMDIKILGINHEPYKGRKIHFYEEGIAA